MTRLLIVLFALILSSSVFAQGFNYSYVKGGLAYIDDRTGSDVDAYGGMIAGSFDLENNNFFLFGSYTDVEFDDVADFDVSELQLGAGYHTPISNRVDFVVGLSWITADVDVDGSGSDSDDGVDASIGLRAWGRGNWELSGGIGVTKLSDSDNDNRVFAGADYYFNQNLTMGVSGAWGDSEIGRYTFNLRYLFD